MSRENPRMYSETEVEKIRGDAYLKGIEDGRKAVIEEALKKYASDCRTITINPEMYCSAVEVKA